MQNNVQQGTVDLNVAVVINKAQLPKFVHEKAHARSRRTDHFGQRFLTHFRDDWLRPTFLSASRVTPSSVPDKSDETPANVALEPATPAGYRNLEFQTDAWSEAYIRRIDDTIAALKTSGVPVFWVGLPPLRGQKSAADIPFLNDLYRSRADKAGIIYIDIWDGFVDEDGRYAQSGPDVQGQTRRLRTSDGVYFTQAGARKLAHYVEREVQRWLSVRPAPVALTIPDEPKVQAPAPAGRSGSHERPLAGPVVPLSGERGSESDDLLGGNDSQLAPDAMAAKVLVRGEPVRAPAGRADDFVWPRRGVAPFGSDPVVATTDLPMTPMTTATMGAATPSNETRHRSGAAGEASSPSSRDAAAAGLCVCAVDVPARLPTPASARTIQLPIPLWRSMVSAA